MTKGQTEMKSTIRQEVIGLIPWGQMSHKDRSLFARSTVPQMTLFQGHILKADDWSRACRSNEGQVIVSEANGCVWAAQAATEWTELGYTEDALRVAMGTDTAVDRLILIRPAMSRVLWPGKERKIKRG